MRDNPRSEWRIEDRPDLGSSRTTCGNGSQKTRGEVRDSVAPKQNLARGKDARLHSAHLLTGFSKCHICGGAMNSVSAGRGVPDWGAAVHGTKGERPAPIG